MRNTVKKIGMGIIALLMILITIAGVMAITEADSNTRGYWTYNNTLTDATGITGSMSNNGATYSATGKIGGSYSFDGTNDWMSNSITLPTAGWTMGAWIYLDSYQTNGRYIFGNGNTGVRARLLVDATGNLKCTVGADSGTGISSETISLSTWYYIAFGFDGSNAFCQVNDGTYYNNSETFTSAQSIDIGQYGGGLNLYYWDGLIDEISFWNKALNSSEITQLYNEGNGCSWNYTSCIYTPPTISNFTINVNNTNDFETTINSINYNTSTGTIITQLLENSTSLWNFTLSASGFYDKTYTNYNVSSDLTTSLIPLPLSNLTITSANDTREAEHTFNWTISNPSGLTTYYNTTLSYMNGTVIDSVNTSTAIYQNWNETNFPVGNYYFNVTAYQTGANTTLSTFQNFTIKPVSDYFKVNAYNYLGTTLISNIITQETHVGSTQTSNPYEYNIYEYLHTANYTQNETAELTITDLSYKHSDYTGNVTVTRYDNWFDINMTPNKLFFTFYQAGALTSTQGWVADDEQSQRFENTTWLIIQQELSDGYVHARFGTTDGVNHTQYYEYINDFTVHIEEEIEVLVQADWSGYIRTLDYAGSPIKDTTIRAYYSFNSENSTPHKLLGQRLTDDGGYTFFWFDSRTEVLLEITKEGYDPIYALITIGDEAYTKTSPLDFYMKTGSDTYSDGNSWVYVKRGFTNRSLDLHGTIMAKNKELVEVTTTYRESEGLSRKTLIADDLERYAFTLVSGSDFSLTTTDDITLYIYLDNELWRTVNVDYDTSDKTRLHNMPETISDILIGIALIFLTVLAGLIFKFQTVGKWTFIVGGVFTGFLSTTYLWVSFICGAYLIFRIIKGVIGE